MKSSRYQISTRGNLDCRVLDALDNAGPFGRSSRELCVQLRRPKSQVLAALALLKSEGCVRERHGLWFYGGGA